MIGFPISFFISTNSLFSSIQSFSKFILSKTG
nr:MAG TPA: hypothetical protein [Caudoviricetes sp.]